MSQGYFKIWRQLLDSRFWLSEKFTRGQAWVDLIGLANYTNGYIRKRGIRINLKRGDLGWSERELAKRWKWSRGKVRRFLDELCSEKESKMIPQTLPQNKNLTSCYHILNYSLYQGDDTTNKATDGPQTGHKQYQNNKEKKDKKENIYPDWLDLNLWNQFKEHRKSIKRALSSQAETLNINKLKKFIDQGYTQKQVIEQTIENGWIGLFEPKNIEKPVHPRKQEKLEDWEINQMKKMEEITKKTLGER